MARRAKSTRQQRRRAARFEPRARMLIVCEGTKTEKYYFENARQVLGVHRGQAVVEVRSGEGSNPKNIVETARNLKIKAEKEGNAFSSVYCIFDRDEHAHYEASIERSKKLKLQTIKSVPCFEYWILLHFRNHTAPYTRTGNRSPCDCCHHDLTNEWPDYAKNRKHLFTELLPRLDNAKQHAEQRLAAAEQDDSNNPSTEIHLLLKAMETLKEIRPIK
ncbi:RloB family protein [Thiolapillus sp.]|nr:RloB family protein [Thiolapillus sp.]